MKSSRSTAIKRALLGGVFMAATTLLNSVSAHAPTPALSGVADNTWLKVTTNGSVTADSAIMAFSGGWYDPVFHQFCLFGGGHWDYSGNEVWCLDIATLSWVEMYPPDWLTESTDLADQGPYLNYDDDFPGVLFNPDGEPISEARPVSRHSYDQMEFVDGLGPVVWGGYSWGDGSDWCGACPDTWAYNHLQTRWHYLFNGDNESPNYDAGVGASAYVIPSGLLYSVAGGATWVYDPGSNEWRELTVAGEIPSPVEASLEYDSTRNVLYFFGGSYRDNDSDLYEFSIATNTWRAPTPGTGPGQMQGPGLAYDNQNDVLLVYSQGDLWAYHPAAETWETINANGDLPSGDSRMPLGRFRYDPINKGFWLHGADHETWFYRYRSNQPPPQPVVSMVASPPAAMDEPVTLGWSASDADSCTASGDWTGDKAISGTASLGVLAAGSVTTYSLQCTGAGGTGSRTITISDRIGGSGSGGRTTSSGGSSGGSSGLSAGWWAVFLLALAGLYGRGYRKSE